MRQIHIQGKTWQYFIGRQNVVIGFPPPNKIRRFTVALSALTGRPQHLIERGQEDGTRQGMVRPSDVKNYIEKNLSKIMNRLDARKKK